MSKDFIEVVIKGEVNAVKDILDKEEVDLSYQYGNYSDNTALHIAVLTENESLVRLLLTKKDKIINYVNNLNKTPLHYAVASCNTAITKILVENGADLYCEDVFGNIPLFYAIVDDVFEHVAVYNDDRSKIIASLLSKMHQMHLDRMAGNTKFSAVMSNIIEVIDRDVKLAYDYVVACSKSGLFHH